MRRGIRFAVVTVLRTVEALTTCVEVSRRLRYIDQSTADRLQKELARNRQLLHGVLRDLARQLARKATTSLIVLACVLWWNA